MYRFPGTSASAPVVASVAIQMLQAQGSLSPEDIITRLEDTAEDMVTRRMYSGQPSGLATLPGGFDSDSGYGLVNAEEAVATICHNPEVTVTLTHKLTTGTGVAKYEIGYNLESNCDLTMIVVGATASSTCNGGTTVSLGNTDQLQNEIQIKDDGGCSIAEQNGNNNIIVDASDITLTITAAFVNGSTLTFSGSATASAISMTENYPLHLRHHGHYAYTRGGMRIYCTCQHCVCQ